MKTLSGEKRLNVFQVFRGILNAYLLTIFLFLALSGVLYFTAISEDIIPKAVIVIGALSIAIGSLNATRDLDYAGWLHGGLIGLLYVGIIMILRFFIAREAGYDAGTFVDLLMGFLIGALAGAIGVNL
ncbi:TIGR04086 family membrane protein [Thermosediminibacter litoriperuensis]|uniref:Putative membrane protein (TIGR04086 family) n=1 Tax=Thermosediminibacter litoriperuensis TaxID=291989 RepID=A0A5S5AF90_9FIRM|nr:TIGR04086 family membrane protein [Thermosediminibacter litoriperuensis]TYP48710.1 putative membrane protein (TIGR04086 family) [Thermosediminibacter litoriperuensis]